MKQIAILGVLIFCLSAQSLLAQNPDDLKFELRLTGDQSAFHEGEAIPVELTYSSDTEKKYQGSFSTPRPEMGCITVSLTPSDGSLDLPRFHNGVAGSYLSGFGYLGSTPRVEHIDLSEWYQFGRNSHYLVRAESKCISRVKSIEEGGGLEHLTLESNAVDIEILPHDPAWAAEELSRLDQILRTQTVERQAWRDALRHLAKLNTPASISRLLEIYLAGGDKRNVWAAEHELQESLQLDSVIPALLAAVTDPSLAPPDGIASLLADLQTRKKLGVTEPYSDDPIKQAEQKTASEKRRKIREEYFRQANDLLLASIQNRTGQQRAAAIYYAWWNAEGLKNTDGISEATLAQLRARVLSVHDELPPDLLPQFLWTGWQVLPHAPLLPLARRFAIESLEKLNGSYDAIRMWCEGEPTPCNTAILDAMRKSRPKPYKPAALLLTESEHPDLDEWLREHLRDPEMVQSSADSQTIAAVILRVGSQNLLPDVKQFLDKLPPKNSMPCEINADLLGYMFRFKPKEASLRLSSELQSTENDCGSQLLRTLRDDRYSDDLIAPAFVALDSANFRTAQTAALLLSEHGPASAQDALWKRLESLRDG